MTNKADRKAVGVYISDGQGRYLLSQRGLSARHESFAWEGTGGEVEEHETFEEAAHREALEELGIIIQDLEEIHEIDEVPDVHGVSWNTRVYVARTKSVPRIDSSGSCAGFGWFTMAEIVKLNIASYAYKDIEALKKYDNLLKY